MKTLVLLHGALGSAGQMEPLRRHLTPVCRVYSMNFPGHGGLPAGPDFSIPYFAESVLAFMERYGLRKTSFFGYSMGGYVALYLAWKHPEKVESVVTLGTKFDWSPEIALKETAQLDPEKIEAKVPGFAAMLAERHGIEGWKEVVRLTAGLLTGLGDHPVLTNKVLSGIGCPVTVCRGELDHMVGMEETARAVRAMPNALLEVLPETKHAMEAVDLGVLAGVWG